MNQNVLMVSSDCESLAKKFALPIEEVRGIIEAGREKLREHRERERPRPSLDDKIVVSWNGLAIGALARTAAALQYSDPEKSQTYLEAAEKAADFIKRELYNEETKTLIRVYRKGPGSTPGFADDYAFLISGLLDLYEATFSDTYLRWADSLQQSQLRQFWDDKNWGFFSTPEGQSDLIMRLKDGVDSAEPSTNGVSSRNLDRLGALLEDEKYVTKARETVSAFEVEVEQYPFIHCSMMDSVVAGRLGMPHIVVTGEGEAVEAWMAKYRQCPQGLGTISRVSKGKGEWLRQRNELVKTMNVEKEEVIVCEKGACRPDLEFGAGKMGLGEGEGKA